MSSRFCDDFLLQYSSVHSTQVPSYRTRRTVEYSCTTRSARPLQLATPFYVLVARLAGEPSVQSRLACELPCRTTRAGIHRYSRGRLRRGARAAGDGDARNEAVG
jgi:hypothetical protein